MTANHSLNSSLYSRKVESGIKGAITVPGDKSISHRALILASQAVGKTVVSGLLEGEDVLNTAKSLKSLGVQIEKEECPHPNPLPGGGGDSSWIVSGVGTGGLNKPDSILDCGNSGTGVRLLVGLVAPYEFPVTFTGDESLKKRPMARVMKPLEKMGVSFQSEEGGRLPITVRGNDEVWPITYTLPVPSAQVKSAILLAALNIPGVTTVIEPEKTRDHTELMLKYLGANVSVKDTTQGREVTITGQPELCARDINVPADPSSAAFVIVAAIITPGSAVQVSNVCVNSLRIGIYKTLIEMGANITFNNEREEGGEKVADIRAEYSELNGVEIPAERAPSMIDEYPILAVAASFAKGETIMNGIAELRVKESDRLSAIIDGLTACGIKSYAEGDALIVEGGNPKGGATIKTYMDHRIAMSFLVMGMVSENQIIVDDSKMIDTSFPGFVGLMNEIGGNIGESEK